MRQKTCGMKLPNRYIIKNGSLIIVFSFKVVWNSILFKENKNITNTKFQEIVPVVTFKMLLAKCVDNVDSRITFSKENTTLRQLLDKVNFLLSRPVRVSTSDSQPSSRRRTLGCHKVVPRVPPIITIVYIHIYLIILGCGKIHIFISYFSAFFIQNWHIFTSKHITWIIKKNQLYLKIWCYNFNESDLLLYARHNVATN